MTKRLDTPATLRKAKQHLCKADPIMAMLIERIGPCRLQIQQETDLFLTLARAIVFQQLHAKAAETIFQRTCALFPKSEQFTAKDIKRANEEKLRSAGLSRNKQLALRDLADKTLNRTLPVMEELHALDNESIIETLTTVRGIGRWTVEMLLMFRLGRPDVLPVDDFGVRKGFMLMHGHEEMPTPKALKIHGEIWAPYRTVASWYLWRATDTPA
ncbi:MAG: DNA-3-methyladenine glycosylase 2 family protein [Pseudomonadota bacterium]